MKIIVSSLDSRLPIKHLLNTNPVWIRQDLGDIKALANSLKLSGQLLPVLVDETFRVIDGARRIEAAKSIGWEEIHAVCTSDFDVISDQLQACRLGAKPMSWLETMELVELLRAIYWPISRRQAVQAKKLGSEGASQRNSGIAVALPRALGLKRGVIDELGRARSMLHDKYRYTPEAIARMLAVIPEIEATGKPYSLIIAMKRAAFPPLPRPSDKSIVRNQRIAFSGAITGLRGAMFALPSPEDLDSGHAIEELHDWDAALTEILQALYQVRKQVRNQHKTEGDQS